MAARDELLAREVFAMFESLFASFDTDSVFDEFRRLENEMVQLFGHSPWPAGIRSAGRGAFRPSMSAQRPSGSTSTSSRRTWSQEPGSIDPAELLTVSGARNVEVNEKAQYYRRERFDGEFRRVITLPDDVDPERVEAKYRDGVLQITIQRHESARPRQITVN